MENGLSGQTGPPALLPVMVELKVVNGTVQIQLPLVVDWTVLVMNNNYVTVPSGTVLTA